MEPPAPPAPSEPAPDTAALTPPPPPQDVPEAVEGEAPAEEAAVPPAEAEAAPAAGGESDTAEAPLPVVPAPEPEAPAAEAAPEPAVTEPAPEAAPAVPAAEEPAPQVAAAGAFRIQLASVKSEADAQKEWTRLQKIHADLLGTLAPTIQRADLGAQGIFYRIQGGPLANREAAAALCEQLKAKNQACLVVKP
jgi:cell division septation protein DedD